MSIRLLALLLLLAAAATPLNAAKQPNILFLFADDQCYDTIHALGNKEIHTPHLDRLVKNGVTFTHAYNQGSWSGAVCVASRTMLVTGRFLWKADKVYRTTEAERRAGRLWPQYMRKAGYETYFTGKWHVRANAQQAFDHAAHVRGGMPNQTPQGYNRPTGPDDKTWQPWDKKFGGFWKGGKHWSEVVADDAVGFLKRAGTEARPLQAAKSPKPFFMYIAFNAAHDPRQAPKEYVDRYPVEKINVPVNFLPQYPYKDGIGCSPSLRDEKLAPFPRTKYAVLVHRREYYALITHMDAQIGRILAALKKTGQADNTWIVFTADHGLACGQHGLFGKQNMYDHSVRVPFIAVGPGVPKGERRDAPIYLQDVMPTTLELAGVKKPPHVEFHSLLRRIKDPAEPSPYKSIYGAYLGLQRAVIHDGWKLILYPKIRKARLYHVAKDPHEQRDVAGDAKNAGRMKSLFGRLVELQKEMGDSLDLKVTFPGFQQSKH
jgi:choline-sulfatase